MSLQSRIISALASFAIAVCVLGLWWLAWALWWPIDAPLVVHSSRVDPVAVRMNHPILVVADAEFRRNTSMVVTPRFDGPGGAVLFAPSTEQHWRAGRYEVRRVVDVPPLAPGVWTYTPQFAIPITPLRTLHMQGVPARFEIAP